MARVVRMTYANAYAIRISLVRAPDNRGPCLSGLLATAVSDRRPRSITGAVDLRPALPAADRARGTGHRRHADGVGPDRARGAGSVATRASARGQGVRRRGTARGGNWHGDRRCDAVRSHPRGRQRRAGGIVARFHRQRISGRAPSSLRRPPAQHAVQRDARVLHHYQSDLEPDSLHWPATRAGQRVWWRRRTFHLAGGRSGRLARLDDSAAGGAVVAAASPGCIAPVNFSTHRHAAGVTSGRMAGASEATGNMARASEATGNMAQFNGKIELDIRDSEPDWGPYQAPVAPPDAPNVLYLVWDDTGIATWDCFGGLVEMPAMSRIAERGVRLSQFHTTALCSPTRASLLTGRNATTVGMATIEEFTDGFPNCNGRIPNDTALLSEVLAERGYNTYCVGKWHLTPLEESNIAATKRHWPLSRGFERFYGFMGGETDQWYPELVYDNHPVPAPATPEEGYHLSKDLADKTIEFIRDAKVIAPDKPWFSYLCPGAGHAPHHVFKDWADKYAGRFDMGYEAYREIVLENQKKLGFVPQDTELSPVNPYLDVKGPNGEAWPYQDTVRPWDTLNDEEKRLFSRMAEVFAGFLS